LIKLNKNDRKIKLKFSKIELLKDNNDINKK